MIIEENKDMSAVEQKPTADVEMTDINDQENDVQVDNNKIKLASTGCNKRRVCSIFSDNRRRPHIGKCVEVHDYEEPRR